ncbi:MAG: Cna B-type domain-containing protein, partial [Lachnospiraceae bacterium]|nr:Cna B-type domain-containing protein [Lachnospiraceae bacterium]
YSVDYSNGTKTTVHNYCLSEGTVIIVIDRPLNSFHVTKEWADNNDQARRKEAIESGVRFLLWRYTDTPEKRAAVFNPETHLQYSYTLKTTDPDVVDTATGDVKSPIVINLEKFGVTEDNPVDMFDQNGVKYVYFATEVISKPGYKTKYDNQDAFKEYSEYGVMNEGTMKNVRQEKMKMEGIVKWNVPSVNDYTKTTVTIELQMLDGAEWKTLHLVEGDSAYTKTLSGFTVTNPKKSYVFPEVERYDSNGNEIKYLIVQTKVSYPEKEDKLLTYTSEDGSDDKKFTSNPFKINDDKYYRASVVPTLDATDSYTIENRLDGDMELVLTKLWEDSGSKGFGKTTSYKNITIKVFQHGTSANYSEPYMTITTGGAYGEDRKGEYFKSHGIEINIDESGNETEKDIPYTITYRAKPGEAPKTETGVIRVPNTDEYRYGDGRAKKWEFKKISGETLSNISLPAFNDNGNAYSYTIEEENVEHAYTTYSYVRTGNELKANVNNKYTEGGGSARTITFQKEWIDGTDIPQEKPIRIAIVRIDEEGKINLKDKLGDEHIVKISENNNWYSQYVLDPEGRFDSEGEGASKRYLYTAIELDMALNGTTDFSRGVTYSDILEDLEKDIDGTKKCTEIKGSIDAYLDTSYEENHLPGYDVTVKATDSVFDARKYVVENKRKGKVNVVFDKNWHDGSNSEGTRTGKYRVYLYQNGKKVVNSASPIDPEKEVCIEGFTESPAEKEYLADNQGKDENKTSFSFEDLPQYDKDGNIYHYSVKEFLVKEDKEGVEKEFEIALTDTKDSSKTGYVVTNHSEKTEFSVDNDTDKTTLWRNDTYEYTNTITGEKTGGVKFYVLWHDQTSYDNGDRPDVNYVLYYKTKNSNQDPQIYKGEYKVEWHPMYDDNAYDNPLKASRYYQYVNFTKLPLANDEGEPYEYYAVPSLNNPGEHYREEYYAEYTVKKAIDETTGNTILTDAGKYHYDIEGTQLAKTDGKPVMLPEDGIVEYTIYDYINVEGIKNWKLDDSGQFDEKKLPDAEIYLWQENRHYKQNSKDNPDGSFLKKTELNENKMGYAFKEKKEGEENYTYIDFPKYDNYGLTYNYSVSEKIYVKSVDPNVKYSIPSYVMKYQEDTNGITNVYNPKDEVGNLRKITVTKDWKKLDGETKSQLELGTEEQWPVAEFGLYRVEIPLYDDYYNLEGPESEKTLSPNPTYKAYDYAIHEFKKFKKIEDGDSTIEDLQKLKKSIAYGATESSAVWEDLPIFSPRGLVYLYFVEELEEHGMDSYDYDVIKAGAGARPSVSVFNEVTTGSDRTNVLIEENDKAKVRAVLFSNHGLAPSVEEDDARNCQEAGYENTFKSEQFGKIIGYKEWTDGIFKNDVRPKIVDKECSEVQLTLTRSAVTQKEHGNQVTSVPVPSTDYKVEWFDEGGNRWRFEITPTDTAKEKEFKLYATNGQPYKYTVTERINGTTLRNYTIANSTLTGTKDKVNDRKEMILPSSLQNKLKGEIKVFKKWDDALNELGLRPEYVKVLLQYRIVPNGDSVGEINYATISQWQDYIDSKSGKREYQLVYKNKWAQSIRELPVYATINGAKYRYEYRLLETEFAYMTSTDDETIVRPIDINDHGNVPNGGFCTDATHDVDRENIYGNSKSTDLNYHNKCYEIEVGSYHVNNSAIARLKDNTTNVSSIDLQVDNKLSNTASLKIEKRWDGVNVSEGLITPVDTYGVLPEFLTFYIEYKKEDDSEDKWTILKDVSGAPVSVQLRNTDDGYVDTIVNQLHRVTGEGDILIYRAIESDENLGRFELSGVDKPKYEYDPEVFDVDRTVCHTIVTNTLKSRDITISKRWNAEKDLRKNVTVELWSNNFTTQDDGFKQVQNTSQLLSESNGWEFTYKNLPIFNTEHQPIQYYVVEASVEGAELNDYAIYFFDQTSQTDYEEVIGSSDDPNIAP